jgi:carbonic anhydrase
VPLRVVHNGHTIQVECAGGGHTRIGDKPYDLVQFHFHHPSEHLVAGKALAMEVHLVHRAADGEIAVLGAFIAPGPANPTLAAIWQVMPRAAGPEVNDARLVDAASLVPGGRVWRYAGSLTTPPCTEIVQWVVYQTPITASAEQIATFAALFSNNARPAQPLGRRFLLRSGG